MSKKPEPIWERVSGERLAEKQKEYELHHAANY